MTNSNHVFKLPHPSCVQTRGIFCWSESSGPSVQKISNRARTKLTYKNSVNIATFDIRTLNIINQLPQLTVSADEHNTDIICIREHRFYHRKFVQKYYDTDNEWKNSVNVAIEGVGILLCTHALKLPNSMDRIQPRIMCASFNSKPCTTDPSISVIKCISSPFTMHYFPSFHTFQNTTF